MFAGLKQHHIGCLVESIDEFMSENRDAWKIESYSDVHTVSAQDVRVCFLQITDDTCLELVEPGATNIPLSKLLTKGTTYYHIGFLSNTYDESVERLTKAGCKQMSEFNSEAFEGRRCSFFYHPSLRLIELIESSL